MRDARGALRAHIHHRLQTTGCRFERPCATITYSAAGADSERLTAAVKRHLRADFIVEHSGFVKVEAALQAEARDNDGHGILVDADDERLLLEDLALRRH